MDYNKIGQFLSQERKAAGLTQVELAEKLCVSEKTVSKWENGKGLPDTESLPTLCEIFGFTLNELLNGERIAPEQYEVKAEEKLLEFQKSKVEKDKQMLKIEIALGVISTVFFFLTMLAGGYLMEAGETVLGAICLGVSVALFFGAATCMLVIEQRAGYYQCAECGHKYVPSFKSVFLAMHMGRTRYMTCPNCGKKSWQKKVVD